MPSEGPSRPPLETTQVLLDLARSGDDSARERLFARVLPVLTRWAHRRLPLSARDLHETDDLVQVSLVRAFRNLDTFENRGEGAFLAYLRKILLNAIRDEIRGATRRGGAQPLPESLADPGPSTIELAMGRETLERYERALATLPDDLREAVILKVEMGYDNARLAEATGRPSPAAARMAVARALVHLARSMNERA
jgi:RNA polymerase sigma-70 factor (ECF subfamily)